VVVVGAAVGTGAGVAVAGAPVGDEATVGTAAAGAVVGVGAGTVDVGATVALPHPTASSVSDRRRIRPMVARIDRRDARWSSTTSMVTPLNCERFALRLILNTWIKKRELHD
jgi:hypothetical protein